MKITWLVAAMLFTSAAAKAEWERPTWKETALMIGAGSFIAADCMTTIDAGRRGYAEVNPFGKLALGRFPSTERVYAVGALSLVASTALWYALPHPWRSIFASSLIVIEGVNNIRQFSIGLNMAL